MVLLSEKNCTLEDMARSMLRANGLPNQFWVEAVTTLVHLLILFPIRVVICQTFFESWKGTKPFISYLTIFHCITYALVNFQFLHKLDEKSKNCIFICYCTQSKSYRLHNPLSKKILIRRDVVFDEMASFKWRGSNDKMQEQIPMPTGITFDAIQ